MCVGGGGMQGRGKGASGAMKAVTLHALYIIRWYTGRYSNRAYCTYLLACLSVNIQIGPTYTHLLACLPVNTRTGPTYT